MHRQTKLLSITILSAILLSSCSQPVAPASTLLPPDLTPIFAPISSLEPNAPVQAGSDFTIGLGDEEAGLPAGAFGLQHIPDGHISFIKAEEQLDLWVSAGVSAYLLRGPNLEQLAPHQRASNNLPVPVLAPDNSGFDSDYAAFGAVLPGQDPNQRIGYYHAEQCDRHNYTASIGLAFSSDGGISWSVSGQVVTGQSLADLCSKITGAGQPSALYVGDYIYLYYVDWSTGDTIPPADQIYLARAPRQAPGAFQKYTGNGFETPGTGAGRAVPVISPPQPLETTGFAALPSISFNKYLGQCMAVFETNVGFYYTISTDGIHWQPAQLLFPFPQPHSQREQGDVWYSYPTLLSPGEPSHLTTSQTGYLYYSKGLWDDEPHQMMRRSYTIQWTNPTRPAPGEVAGGSAIGCRGVTLLLPYLPKVTMLGQTPTQAIALQR